MLEEFSVTNFKNFNENFTLDLSKTKNYEFNAECVDNGIVKKGLIYGPNGCGKSNLGYAIFDIVSHLTDNRTLPTAYQNYLNADNDSTKAEFCYHFNFNGSRVVYTYTKTSQYGLISELLEINDKTVISFNRNSDDEAYIALAGSETLKRDMGDTSLSVIKYVLRNALLKEDEIADIFTQLIEFVDGMVFLNSTGGGTVFIGKPHLKITPGTNNNMAVEILESGKLKGLEAFLQKAGVSCNLTEIQDLDGRKLAFSFKKGAISFSQIASTGTQVLAVFYFWLQRLQDKEKVSFVFIDEFDAYYHQKLSKMVIEEVKKAGCQALLTTHNTSIMTNDLLRPDCYFLMTNDQIKPIYAFTDKELRQAHNIEKMYKAGAFDG